MDNKRTTHQRQDSNNTKSSSSPVPPPAARTAEGGGSLESTSLPAVIRESRWYRLVANIPDLMVTPTHRPHVKLQPPAYMPADVKGLERFLNHISARDIPDHTKSQVIHDIVANYCSALTTGRLTDKVYVMLIGETGHGKSSTINKLIGHELREAGHLESTTKDIECVNVSAIRRGVRATLSFVDTPGLMDTTDADRQVNADTFTAYRTRSFKQRNENTFNDLTRLLSLMDGGEKTLSMLGPFLRLDVYPNVVLLVATWDSIKKDAQNPPEKFTSPMGRAIYALSRSSLFDAQRPNIILVVTKSISATLGKWPDLLDDREEQDEWVEESRQKEKIIRDIQEKAFPGTMSWPIVFVENWSGSKLFTRYNTLPNGQLSHQNLFDAMSNLFGLKDTSGRQDLLGLQALATVIAGVKARGYASHKTLTLQRREDSKQATPEPGKPEMMVPSAKPIHFKPKNQPKQETTRASPTPLKPKYNPRRETARTTYDTPMNHENKPKREIAGTAPTPSYELTAHRHRKLITVGDLNRVENAHRSDEQCNHGQQGFWGWVVAGATAVIATVASSCTIQ